jgi:hypothetical protein
LTWLVVTACLATAISTSFVAAQVGRGPIYDVIPSAWIRSDGTLPRSFPADTRNGQAFVFPSLLGDDIAARVSAGTPPGFFRTSNKFPNSDEFSWRSERRVAIRIRVDRRTDESARITVEADSMRSLRNLDWPAFLNLQRQFREWLLCKAGCTIFTNPQKRFVNLEPELASLWRALLAQSRFANFATSYLNDPADPEIEYVRDEGTFRMRATPVTPPEALSISWGTTSVYPLPPTGLNIGATRLAAAGSLELQIWRGRMGVALFAPGTPTVSTISPMFGLPNTNAQLPFPPAIADLFGRVLVPIYTPLDLHNERVLRYKTGSANEDDAFDDRLPRHVAVLSPLVYVKAEPNDAAQAHVAQFATDARVNRAAGEPDQSGAQLTRRFVLIGVSELTPVAIGAELKRLVDGGFRGGPGPNESGHVMAVFANQTALEVRRHIAVDGRLVAMSEPRRQTWAQVVDRMMAPLLVETHPPPSAPALAVHRLWRRLDGTAIRRITVRVHVADHEVLDAAQIGEGDDFEQSPHVSKVLR